ncbi:MAG TPA: hypothetical protein VNX00_05680, partial [Herbaspirillum sp.]|nr:hypothetical protein [Herbaspirillum sp.]
LEFRIRSRCRLEVMKTDQKKILFERSEFIFFPFSSPLNGHPRRGQRLSGRLLLLTFLGGARKVSGCRAAPGLFARSGDRTNTPKNFL